MNFGDVGGMLDIKQELHDEIIIPLDGNIGKYEDSASPSRTSSCTAHQAPVNPTSPLHSPEGCSTRTSNSAQVILSQYINASGEKVNEIFDEAETIGEQHGHAIICLDEIDALLASRDMDQQHSGNKKVVNKFLNHLEGTTNVTRLLSARRTITTNWTALQFVVDGLYGSSLPRNTTIILTDTHTMTNNPPSMPSDTPSQSRPTDLQNAVNAYLNDRTKTTGDGNYHSSATSVLKQWVTWNHKHGNTSLEDLTPTEIRRYIQHLNNRTDNNALAASTIHTYFNIIRGCLSWCVTDSRTDINPADSHPAIEALPDDTTDPDNAQQFWTEKQIQQIIRHVNKQAHTAIDEDGLNAHTAVRDRALATTLTFSGARGAELFSSPHDSRKGRNGITWKRVDLDNGTLTVLGKNQDWEPAQLPDQAIHALEQHYRVQDPASDEWPVFPSGHAPTIYNTARETLAEQGYTEERIDALVSEAETAHALVRDHDIAPPPLTTEGARSVMKRLCDAADIDVDGEYLKPHGARRGLGNILYKEQAELAQSALRHESVETTHDSYADLVASETSDTVSNVLNATFSSEGTDSSE